MYGQFNWPTTGVTTAVELGCPYGSLDSAPSGRAVRECVVFNGVITWAAADYSLCKMVSEQVVVHTGRLSAEWNKNHLKMEKKDKVTNY